MLTMIVELIAISMFPHSQAGALGFKQENIHAKFNQ